MPLVKIEQIDEDTKILIWYIKEDVHFFESHLEPFYDTPVPWHSMNSKRKKEFLATRYLIQLGLAPGQTVNEIYKDGNGSPRMATLPGYLGISHTKEFVSCVISNRRTGCDIERFQERILRLDRRFMTSELSIWASDEYRLAKTHLIWGIKESAYKTWGQKQIDWNKHIHIDPIDWNPQKGMFTGSIGNYSGTLDFRGGYEYFTQFLFVWTIEI